MYFDIDDILTETANITCIARNDCASLAFLRPYNSTSTTVSSNVLAEGEKCELPLWACISLALESRFFDMQLPKHYGDSFRKKLDGGGENFNLRIKSLYYYEVGELLCSRIKRIPTSRRGTDNRLVLIKKEAEILREVLKKTFVGERFRKNLDWSLNSSDEDVTAHTSKLAHAEKELFDIGARSSYALESWKNHGSRRIEISSIVKASNDFIASNKRVVSPEAAADSDNKRPRVFG
ncbi:hypothetical protein TrCOL_g10199 [Triparma columacea]|uniref:DNA replication complex GINS protein PSF3 N-terminal domain-containing protein n=1 Tax=Triparma columacea TaxID=722753 RepID=A0A9W7G869_9STRA|nr:hypothetical protein TrCOL_g10199 [Triparma columacea]